MSVPKHTTPAPFNRYRDESHTPAWVESARRDTPGFAAPHQPRDYGRPAKKTMTYKPKYRPEHDSQPLLPTAMFFTREVCWDCEGDGKSGAILYHCPVCGEQWPWAQIEAHASRHHYHVRDQWGAIFLPCSDHCGRIPSARLYKIHEACPTCNGLGYRDIQRSFEEILQAAFEYHCQRLGINGSGNDATMPTPAAAKGFQQSEPTAPPPHLEHPGEHPAVRVPDNFTPTLKPLTPDEF